MPMAGQVLTGLEQIHDLGYLHRDISPKRELCGELQSAPANWGITYEARTDIGTRKVNQDNLMVDGLLDQVNAICFGRAGSPASAHPIRRHR